MSVGGLASLQQNNWVLLAFKCLVTFECVDQTITIGFEQNWIHFQGAITAAMISIMRIHLAYVRRNDFEMRISLLVNLFVWSI